MKEHLIFVGKVAIGVVVGVLIVDMVKKSINSKKVAEMPASMQVVTPVVTDPAVVI